MSHPHEMNDFDDLGNEDDGGLQLSWRFFRCILHPTGYWRVALTSSNMAYIEHGGSTYHSSICFASWQAWQRVGQLRQRLPVHSEFPWSTTSRSRLGTRPRETIHLYYCTRARRHLSIVRTSILVLFLFCVPIPRRQGLIGRRPYLRGWPGPHRANWQRNCNLQCCELSLPKRTLYLCQLAVPNAPAHRSK
jgi:hypothetical protein